MILFFLLFDALFNHHKYFLQLGCQEVLLEGNGSLRLCSNDNAYEH